MPIKPVDFQVAIPRTTEASKISSNDANKNLAAQQQSAESVQHKADNSARQVQSRSKSEEARINEKQKENNRKNAKKDGKKENSEGEGKKKNLNKEMQTSTIDIKI